MNKLILGLDLGSNSLGWGLLEAGDGGKLEELIDAGVRIFPKAVEKKTPIPKSQKRRNSRLARRTIQRRARRKRQLLNYLVSLSLLPKDLLDTEKPEGILNRLGDPYLLRAKALDEVLTTHQLGRVILHLVQRRGFLSNKKTILGRDMLDDPDVLAVLGEGGDVDSSDAAESSFKAGISHLRQEISDAKCRTLGEYLASKPDHVCKRNRHGQHLRTDRQMYQDELDRIFRRQTSEHPVLTDKVQARIAQIIFHQRPLKLKSDRVGRCSLEPQKKRAAIARLEYQRFRYLQDINNLGYFDPYTEQNCILSKEDRNKLIDLFETIAAVTFKEIRTSLGFDKKIKFNLESDVKKLRGNTTVAAIRAIYSNWGQLPEAQQYTLVEDLLSIKKKSALKRRLMGHWQLDGETAVKLCMMELEPDYGSVSLKAIGRLMPYLKQGMIYSEACKAADYGYEVEISEPKKKLGAPPELPNPIVNKGLHELKRVVNAIIKEYGKPDVIRIEMARDLEMNTKRYKSFIAQQSKNTKANDKAVEAYQQVAKEHTGLKLGWYPSRDQKIRYRLWEEQGHCCAYSRKSINLETLFSPDVEVDHILPYSQSLDDSYMNKVVCFAKENQQKGQNTPIDAFVSNPDKWGQITQAISRWPRELFRKRDRFYCRANELPEDFIGSQLTDTRYISKEAGAYLKTLGCDVTYTRGVMTACLRRMWKLNDLIGNTAEKERSDHRHHAIDAVVTGCIGRSLYNTWVAQAKDLERHGSNLTMDDIYIDPPIADIKQQLSNKLDSLIVSHVPQRKITGALHEETGVGFIEGKGTVYRQMLDQSFKSKKAVDIIDDTVKELVTTHLEKYGNDAKKAFAEEVHLFHLDGKTLIKRVRVIQSKTTREKLEKSKFPVRGRKSEVFKWHAYGNTHHVEILRHKNQKDRYTGCFVTAMEAVQRVRKNSSQPLIQTDHGPDWEFVMALHINDLVQVTVKGKAAVYRVQKLSMETSQLTLRLHTAATVKSSEERILKTINTLMNSFYMRPLSVNAIGKLCSD